MLHAIFALRRSVFMGLLWRKANCWMPCTRLTEGNPFFIEELLKSLIEAGDIFYEHGRWERKELQ